ncbi:MAG: WecB/TagA/CpsF family glycosyltransferase [Vampirovibrionales bacterium]|nr:WecB/TagA/CpsF family glycosyltransferase [Vampirovibrionales bacterium]
MRLPKRRLLGADITEASFEDVVNAIIALGRSKESAYVCVSSVHMIMEAESDPEFKRLLNQAAIATPDGRPVSVFMNLLYGCHQEQIAGHDLMIRTLKAAGEAGLSVYFYGSTPPVLSHLGEKIRREYPGVVIAGLESPPFRPLSPQEHEDTLARINASGAHIVMVALGCPKQERWMAERYGKIPAVMIGLGAAFPFFSGDVKRAPRWVQHLCLEWAFRMTREPRLFLRYLHTNPRFLWGILKQSVALRLK